MYFAVIFMETVIWIKLVKKKQQTKQEVSGCASGEKGGQMLLKACAVCDI